MREIFLTVLDMSLSAAWLIAAVVLMRVVFRRVSRAWICLLWAFVGVRLCVPFTVESPIGLLPQTDVVFERVVPSLPREDATELISWVWIIGVAGLVVYAVISFLLLRRRVTEAAHLREEIYVCDKVDAPFLLGLFRPRIYLPVTLSEKQISYVVAHERAHQKRLDHIWKPLGFCLLIAHWFNPLAWLAYLLFCRDMELACDESAVCGMSLQERKGYSRVLLSCSMPIQRLSAYPIAFGEGAVKHRIHSVLSYKKPTIMGTAVAVLIMTVTVIGFMTSPVPRPTWLPNHASRNGGWTILSDFYENGTGNLCAYRTMETGNGRKYTCVVLEEDGLYYTCEYAGAIDEKQVSFDRQLHGCDGVYTHAAIDTDGNSLTLYAPDGRAVVQ